MTYLPLVDFWACASVILQAHLLKGILVFLKLKTSQNNFKIQSKNRRNIGKIDILLPKTHIYMYMTAHIPGLIKSG
jgi:hypothetical protein